MRISFDNIEKPKYYAKKIKKTLENNDIFYTLTKCQLIIAIMSGYKNWKELKSQIGKIKKSIPTDISNINMKIWQESFDENVIIHLMRFYSQNMVSNILKNNLCQKIISDFNHNRKPIIIIGSKDDSLFELNPMNSIISTILKFIKNPNTYELDFNTIDNNLIEKRKNVKQLLNNINCFSPNLVFSQNTINCNYIARHVSLLNADNIILNINADNIEDTLKKWCMLTCYFEPIPGTSKPDMTISNRISKVIYYSKIGEKTKYEYLNLDNVNETEIKDFLDNKIKLNASVITIQK